MEAMALLECEGGRETSINDACCSSFTVVTALIPTTPTNYIALNHRDVTSLRDITDKDHQNGRETATSVSLLLLLV